MIFTCADFTLWFRTNYF